MKTFDLQALGFEGDSFFFIDQTRLPFEEVKVRSNDYERISLAIERLEIRGAPAIGCAAAYALALSYKQGNKEIFQNAYERLKRTRPTAVNLFHGLDTIYTVFSSGGDYNDCINTALAYHKADAQSCRSISVYGGELLAGKKNPITICNTGAFAVGGEGTALGVIKQLHKVNPLRLVTACETRPLLQGARLTAFELDKAGIPFRLIADSASAFFMDRGEIDFAIAGADRIAVNGDTANKIGTLMLAQLCSIYKIPFYIAAPFSTIDAEISSGDAIPVEFRSPSELHSARGVQITSGTFPAANPAFDVTPSHLISGIITDKGFYSYPYAFSK